MELKTAEQKERYYNSCMKMYEGWSIEGCERVLKKVSEKINRETFHEVQIQALTDSLILKRA